MSVIFDIKPSNGEESRNPNEHIDPPVNESNAPLFDVVPQLQLSNVAPAGTAKSVMKPTEGDHIRIPRKTYDFMRQRTEDYAQLQDEIDIFANITRRMMFFLSDFPNHADSLEKIIDFYMSISAEVVAPNGEISRVVNASTIGMTGIFRLPFTDIQKVSGAINLAAFDGFTEELTPEAFIAFEQHQIPVPAFEKLLPILMKYAKKTEQPVQ